MEGSQIKPKEVPPAVFPCTTKAKPSWGLRVLEGRALLGTVSCDHSGLLGHCVWVAGASRTEMEELGGTRTGT